MQQLIRLRVNGVTYETTIEPQRTLLEVLRDNLGFTGAKKACDTGDCGACTIIMNGKAVVSCLILAVEAQGKDILTIEGLAKDGQPHPIQQAFVDHGAIQCGFCTPGMILSAKALLDRNPKPTKDEVKDAMVGNLCRCTGYTKIVEAILAASQALQLEQKRT